MRHDVDTVRITQAEVVYAWLKGDAPYKTIRVSSQNLGLNWGGRGVEIL